MVNALEDCWSIVGYDHKYISPTWSATVARAGLTIPAIATPHYRNGNIFSYVRLHPSADRLEVMYQASSAFMHIHSKDVVHGNICSVSLPRSSGFLTLSGLLTKINSLGKHVHRQRWDDARDRYSCGHASTPEEQQQQYIRSIKLDVQSPRRIGMG